MHPSVLPPSGESTPESPLSGHHQPAAAAEGVSPEGPKRSGGRAKHVDSPGAEATQRFDSTHKFSGRPEKKGLRAAPFQPAEPGSPSWRLGRCGHEGVDAYLEVQTIVLPGDYAPSA